MIVFILFLLSLSCIVSNLLAGTLFKVASTEKWIPVSAPVKIYTYPSETIIKASDGEKQRIAEAARIAEEKRKAEEEAERQRLANVPRVIPQQVVANELAALGLPVDYFLCTIGRESHFIENARNIYNGIVGITQITYGTWQGAGCTGDPTNYKDALACTLKIYRVSGRDPWTPKKFVDGVWVDDPSVLHC